MGKKTSGRLSRALEQDRKALPGKGGSREARPPLDPPSAKGPGGRPTTYRPEYCDMLIEHMKQGFSFRSFGSKVAAGRATLYQWVDANAEFADAAQKGREACSTYYENLGKMMATGQLRRIAKEEPVLNDRGEPVIDPNTGLVLKRYEYAPTQGNAAAWIFLTKNLLGWRDKADVAFEGVPGGTPIQFKNATELTDEQLKAEIKALAQKALEEG
jgi:hypothetical protein